MSASTVICSSTSFVVFRYRRSTSRTVVCHDDLPESGYVMCYHPPISPLLIYIRGDMSHKYMVYMRQGRVYILVLHPPPFFLRTRADTCTSVHAGAVRRKRSCV